MNKKQPYCRVVLSPNPVKTSERIDINGNIIDPLTKRIIKPKESDSISQPPPPPPAPPTPPEVPDSPPQPAVPVDMGLDVLDEIKAAKQRLKDLEELRKLKIEEKKKELELLEKQ